MFNIDTFLGIIYSFGFSTKSLSYVQNTISPVLNTALNPAKLSWQCIARLSSGLAFP